MPIYYGQLQRRIAEERAEYASCAERTGPIYHCVYRPHNIECHELAEYKLIESDTGKEYYSCERHISQYRDLNERCGYEKFVIVPIVFKRKRAEEQQEPHFREAPATAGTPRELDWPTILAVLRSCAALDLEKLRQERDALKAKLEGK